MDCLATRWLPAVRSVHPWPGHRFDAPLCDDPQSAAGRRNWLRASRHRRSRPVAQLSL